MCCGGYPAPAVFAVVAGLSEVVGGLLLATGLLTPLAVATVVGVMVNAYAAHWG
ncbi:MAG: DoxX family membrane protein, partial [Streptosporangiales bacterium]|nr:DoxX family membrane protein [Streptosporangiales bacterium]